MKTHDIARFLNIPITTVEDVLQEPSSLDHVVSTQHAEELYRRATEGSESKRLIMVKWLSLCATAEEAQEAYRRASSESEDERLAIVRWDELSLEEVTSAEIPEQVIKAYYGAHSWGKAARLAIRKLAEMPDEE